MKLIDEWKSCHKFWSVRLQVAGAAIVTFVQGFPDAFVHIWSDLPPDITAAFPSDTIKWIGIAVIAAGIFARIVRQDRLHAADGVGGSSQPEIPRDGR